MTFLKKVLRLVDDKGITKNKLLTDLGMNKNSFVVWEKRGTIPASETILKISDYFNVTTDYLLGKTDDPNPPANDLKPPRQQGIELSPDALEFARAYEKADLGTKNGLRRFMGLGEIVPAEEKVTVFRAARGGDGADPKLTEISRERLDRLKNASDVEEI